MRLLTGAVLAVALTACAGTSGAGSSANRPSWCVDVDSATSHMNDLSTGLDQKTLTPDDAAKLMGKVSSDLKNVALLSSGSVQAAAQAGMGDAGRIRVALLGAGDVSADSTDLKTQLAVVQPPCQDG